MRCTFLLLLCVLLVTPSVEALSVDDAYQAIPHRRTVFDSSETSMTQGDREYLEIFYRLVDEAIVQRVSMLMYLSSQGDHGEVSTAYDRIIYDLEVLEPPVKIKQAHHLVIAAIKQQREFLDNWYEQSLPSNTSVASDAEVRGASQKLRQAYSIMLSAYPIVSVNNKKSFFDYLCALDFI
ncbi:MAG: hypothetical protein ACI9F2_000690 [Lysobacterales bacterium]|jgi:hypothetical protein